MPWPATIRAAAGSRQRRRRSAGSAGASPRRAPKETRAAVAPARRRGGATPAPPGDTAATERQNPIGVLANAAPPSQSGPAALWMAPVQVALHRARPPLLRRRSSRPAPWRMAPMPAPPCRARRSPLRRRSGHLVCPLTADRAARRTEQGAWPRRVASLRGQACRARPSPLRRRSRYSACPPDRGPSDASAGAAAHTTRDSVHSRHQSPPRRHIPAAVRRHIWLRDGGRCCYREPLSGRRCTSSHLLQIDHLLPVAEGGGAPDIAPPPRCWRATRLRWPTACRWPGGDTLRSPAVGRPWRRR